jgi:hypothetical protein
MKTCPVCDTAHARGGIYCSRKCCRRVSNAKARGTTVRPPIAAFDCEQCGKHCVPGVNVAAHASRFCGKDCKVLWHKAVELALLRRATRRKRAERALARAAAGIGPPRVFIAGRCAECAHLFVGITTAACFCSDRCRRRSAHRRARRRWRRSDNPTWMEARRRQRRSRARRLGYREAFPIWVIGDRDGWVCGICNRPVDALLEVPHAEAGTVDHVVALASGGPHALNNVQLAHFMCNSLKRDT